MKKLICCVLIIMIILSIPQFSFGSDDIRSITRIGAVNYSLKLYHYSS